MWCLGVLVMSIGRSISLNFTPPLREKTIELILAKTSISCDENSKEHIRQHKVVFGGRLSCVRSAIASPKAKRCGLPIRDIY